MDGTGELHGFGALTQASHQTSSGSKLSFYYTGPARTESVGGTVLVLLHGWPEMSYMWRHLIPMLSEKYRLFVPDLPGYGNSTPTTDANDKLTYGTAVIEALHATYSSPIRVVFIGHDRGARVVHRLAVSRSQFPGLDIVGVVLADIVPTVEQFAAFSNPATLSRYFHWGFLPNVALSVPMIKAFGSGKFCRMLMQASPGANAEGAKSLLANGSVDMYASHYEKESVVLSTAKDYEAAAKEDYAAQVEDQKAGRKVDVPILVLYSAQNLGAMVNVPEIWKNWVKEGTRLKAEGFADGYGHFFLEEAPELSFEHIIKFVESVDV